MIFTYCPCNAGKSHVITVLLFPWFIYFGVFRPFFFFTRPGKSFWFVQQVTLGKVLKAIVVMRSLFIDRTIVRGFSENIYNEDGKVRLFFIYLQFTSNNYVSVVTFLFSSQLDIWTKSQYQVFQKVCLKRSQWSAPFKTAV